MPQHIDSYPPSDHSGPPAIESQERAALIVQLKREGKSFATIGTELGLSRQRCHEIFHQTLRDLPAVDVREYRAAELERLEYLREQVQRVIAVRHKLAYQGLITDIDDDGPLLDAIRTDLKISERISKLVGADAPVRTELGGSIHNTYELRGFSPDDV
jgi:AraC-like DNA-binding protein